jgi:DNA polymerase-3 subunit beta
MSELDFESLSELQDAKQAKDCDGFQIRLNRNFLLNALAHTQNIVDKRNIIPLLSNVKLHAYGENLSLMATDMDLLLSEILSAEVIVPGSLTISAHLFYDVVRKLPSAAMVSIYTKSDMPNKVIIESEGCAFELPYLKADEFPQMDDIAFTHQFTLSSGELQSIFDKSKYTMSVEETRYNLNGIYLHVKEVDNGNRVLRGVATDGHRLSCIDVSLPDLAKDLPGVIIPRKAVIELRKIIEDSDSDVEVMLSENRIKFSFDSVVLLTKLVDGNFPEYEGLVPHHNTNWMRVNRDLLSKAVDRVATIVFEKSCAVKMIIKNDVIELLVSGQDNSHAKEILNIESNCAELQIGFNFRYILEALSTISDDVVEFRFLDSFSPAMIKGAEDQSCYNVIMPMRV